MPKAPFRIGLVGFGNIGTGFVRHYMDYNALLNGRVEGGLELVGVAVRNVGAAREAELPEGARLTGNWRELVSDASIDAIIEVVGVGADGKPAFALDVAREALSSGKHFITANKALIAEHGGELMELAERHGVLLLFEASVGAGIPIIASLQSGLAPNRITSIHGILNGTCNYILSRMEDEGAPLEAVLADAQRLGYAEPDPRFDVEGDDTAYKIAILASLGFGQELKIEHIEKEGIVRLGLPELEFARRNGLTAKLLASAELHPGELADVRVRPAFIPVRHVLGGVRGVNNGILVNGAPIGEVMMYGAGAGQASTSSGLLSDVITAARHWNPDAGDPHPLRIPRGVRNVFPRERRIEAHYVRVDGAGPEALARMLPGSSPAGDGPGWAAATLPPMEGAAFNNLLGNIAASGISRGNTTHVRFAFAPGA